MTDTDWQWSEVAAAWPLIQGGFAVSVTLTLLVIALGLPAGLVLGLLTSPRVAWMRPLGWLLTTLLAVPRLLPGLVVVAAFFVLWPASAEWLHDALGQFDPGPAADGVAAELGRAVAAPPFAIAAVALAVVLAARTEFIVRSSVRHVSTQLRAVARAMGMSRGTELTRVILPMTARGTAAPLLGAGVRVFRDSTLAAFIGVADVLFVAVRDAPTPGTRGGNGHLGLELFTLMAIGFLVILVPAELFIRWLTRSRWMRRGERRAVVA
ncbi:MAG: ABC transporter permease subunit [Phycisphaerales bacterium]|nr:ABC transporter permease subunit [Phycisphaerae bacterium]NNF43157.1 ABC transporter permease subunit [Phycisphaerales bacterium]NNM27271.1 ABC transporter permease subunit [Phycisphaerales bacterium]